MYAEVFCFCGDGLVDYIKDKLKTLPERSGVYIMKNSTGEVIYVGKAKILKNRVKQYFTSGNHSPKVLKMVENIADFEYIITDTEQEALILENNLIKENNPKYNILLKDDKTYPFIKITVNEEFPRIMITRRIIRDGARYFGPYCSNFNVKELVELISEIFCFRKCKKNISSYSNNDKPCLYYQMGKCSAPCAGKISADDYKKAVNDAIDFINGKESSVKEILTRNMKNAAEAYDFETAAIARDRLKAVALIGEKQKIVSASGLDYDAIAVYNDNDMACVEIFFIRSGKIIGNEHYFLSNTDDSSNGVIISEFIKQYYENSTFIPTQLLVQDEIENVSEIEKWLSAQIKKAVKISVPKIGDKYKLISMIASNAKKEHSERQFKIMRDISFKNNALISLQKLTSMDRVPMNIESYDISNISSSAKVGAMVCFAGGKPCRSKYKNFKIKYVSGQDDYMCMAEVISRRIERGLSELESNDGSDSPFLPLPDLILVDGGMGHVNKISRLIKNYSLNIPVFGMAKDERHRTSGLVGLDGNIEIDKSGEAFMLLTQIQDEIHRRAISYHRSLRDGNTLKSELLRIRGVGEKKALILLKKFKSIKKIKDASIEELSEIVGIDETTAKNVFCYFNGE